MYALSGMYQAGMKYEQAKALALKLAPTTRQALLQAAVSALPACYSQELDNCLYDRPNRQAGCAAIMEGYVANWDAIDKVVKALPHCAAPLSRVWLVGGGVALVLLGVGVGLAVGGQK